jgi:hypothetical protein
LPPGHRGLWQACGPCALRGGLSTGVGGAGDPEGLATGRPHPLQAVSRSSSTGPRSTSETPCASTSSRGLMSRRSSTPPSPVSAPKCGSSSGTRSVRHRAQAGRCVLNCLAEHYLAQRPRLLPHHLKPCRPSRGPSATPCVGLSSPAMHAAFPPCAAGGKP